MTTNEAAFLRLLREIQELRAEIKSLHAAISARQVPLSELPAELTVAQAMRLTNHRSVRAFHYWCRARRVRPISRGRYSRRRIDAALAA